MRRNDNHWIAYAITVDGQLWAWKGERTNADASVKADPYLSMRYWPPTNIGGKVELHVALFDLGVPTIERVEHTDAWYAKWPPRPDNPCGFQPETEGKSPEDARPIRSASFEYEVRTSPLVDGTEVRYWTRKTTPHPAADEKGESNG